MMNLMRRDPHKVFCYLTGEPLVKYAISASKLTLTGKPQANYAYFAESLRKRQITWSFSR